MKEFRLGKDDINHYSSLEELRAAFKLKPITKRTTDEKKLAEQRKKFLKTCRCCENEMTYVSGTNTIVCANPQCKGYKKTYTDSDGAEKAYYIPVTRTLDETGFEIAMNLFD